jgi:hypothetical protein
MPDSSESKSTRGGEPVPCGSTTQYLCEYYFSNSSWWLVNARTASYYYCMDYVQNVGDPIDPNCIQSLPAGSTKLCLAPWRIPGTFRADQGKAGLQDCTKPPIQQENAGGGTTKCTYEYREGYFYLRAAKCNGGDYCPGDLEASSKEHSLFAFTVKLDLNGGPTKYRYHQGQFTRESGAGPQDLEQYSKDNPDFCFEVTVKFKSITDCIDVGHKPTHTP